MRPDLRPRAGTRTRQVGSALGRARVVWLCGSLLAPLADERWLRPRAGDSCLASSGPTRCWPGRRWPFLDRCLPCRQRGAGQRGAPAAKRGRTTLTGDEWRPSSATRWGQNPFTINASEIVNWGLNSPAGGARTHPRSQSSFSPGSCAPGADQRSSTDPFDARSARGRTRRAVRRPLLKALRPDSTLPGPARQRTCAWARGSSYGLR